MIADFHCNVDEVFALVGCSALLNGSYRHFGTTYGSHFNGQAVQEPLKMGPICCPETSVTNYQSTLHNVTEEQKPHD
jgi:hypothetical protein